MITLYSGTPGSGKSLHTAEKIYYALRAGRPVLCNFDVNLDFVWSGLARGRRHDDRFLYVPNDQLRPEALQAFSDAYFSKHRFREDHVLVVIDEAQLLFNAREWSAAGRAAWLSFFSQHRKFGIEVILVAQFDRMLDRQIRSLIEYEYIHRKVSNFGIWGKLFSLVALGKLFVCVKMWYPLKERIGAEWFVCRKKFFRLYDTYKRFGDDAQKEDLPAAQEVVQITENGVKFYEVS